MSSAPSHRVTALAFAEARSISSNARELHKERLFAFVQRQGTCTSTEAARAVGRSEKHARDLLGELASAGRIAARVVGKATVFERLPALVSVTPIRIPPHDGTAASAGRQYRGP